jgi:hypothetical protein
MVSPFEIVILRLKDLGFFTFLLPFILVAAILYGLLRKSQIFGPPEKNIAVNAVVALVASFMVWAAPVIAGINIEQELSRFFVQSMSATLALMVAILLVGMFLPPDLPKMFGEKFGGKNAGVFIAGAIVVGIAILVTSGLTTVFFPSGGFAGIPEDVLMMVGVLAMLLIGIILIVWLGGGRKEAK